MNSVIILIDNRKVEIGTRIAELEESLTMEHYSSWHLYLKGKSFPEKKSDLIAIWILKNKNAAKKVLGNTFVDIFELSVLKWIVALNLVILPDTEIFDFVLGKIEIDPWGSFVRDWETILVGGSVAAASGFLPCFIKIYRKGDPFSKLWLCSDGITPKVFRLHELLHSEYKFWDSDLWQGYQTEYDEFDENFNPIENIPKEVLNAITIGCRSDLDYAALSPMALGFGFKKGSVSYISSNHDEWICQKKLSVE